MCWHPPLPLSVLPRPAALAAPKMQLLRSLPRPTEPQTLGQTQQSEFSFILQGSWIHVDIGAPDSCHLAAHKPRSPWKKLLSGPLILYCSSCGTLFRTPSFPFSSLENSYSAFRSLLKRHFLQEAGPGLPGLDVMFFSFVFPFATHQIELVYIFK